MRTIIAVLCFMGTLTVKEVGALTDNWYYTGHGGLDGNCPSRACDVCPTGQFRSGCGKHTNAPTSQYIEPGSCVDCTLKPEKSTYTAYANGVVAFKDSDCPFTCDAGYSFNGTSCVPNLCDDLEDVNKVYTSGPPGCSFVCVAGYRGNTATNPSTCTICERGTFSLQGSSTCTNCAAGKSASNIGSTDCAVCLEGSFSSTGASTCTPCLKGTFGATKGLTACTPCPSDDGTGAPTYADTVGKTACSSCEVCTQAGEWKSGCGGDKAGTCISCS
jgi:hypothetical protein